VAGNVSRPVSIASVKAKTYDPFGLCRAGGVQDEKAAIERLCLRLDDYNINPSSTHMPHSSHDTKE
jgi:hypothetical protein